MDRARIVYGVGRVQPQSVHVELGDPVTGISNKEFPHLVGFRPVEIDRRAPISFVAIGKVVVTVGSEVITVGAQVVVDDIENDTESCTMRRIYKTLERLGIPIHMRRRVEIHPVVPPVSGPRKFGHQHHLDHGHAQLLEFFELPGRRGESSFLGKGSDMQLIDDLACHRDPETVLVMPLVSRRIHDHGWAMRTLRLESRARIWKTTFSIETVSVESASRGLGDQPRKIAAFFGSERDGKAVFDEDLDPGTLGGPHSEPHSFSAALRSESQPPMACGWAR